MILCVYSQDLIRLRKLNDSRRLWVGNHQDSSDGRSFEKAQVRDLIRRMSFENPLWGAPKIHGELLKLGIEVA
jgi:hypothetical protein